MIPTLLDLVKAYACLVTELEVTYYLQDSDKINAQWAEVNRIEDALGVKWTSTGPVTNATKAST